MAELSIIIPARNEMFLKRTIDDILINRRGDTEIIVVLDGQWADPPIPDDPRVTLIYHSESIGQRAATNEAVRISKAKYIMKVDAHCSFDQGFDVKMIEVMQDNWTMVPIMRNLHAFDWICKKCGNRTYQGPTPVLCPKCDNKTDFERDIVWIGKHNPQSTSYCFDSEPHFQYFNEFKSRPEYETPLNETMSLQGSCFMITREKYWELNICDEKFGSWGTQGIEVAVKTWLSGGRVICNKNTWYAHMFRTQGGDFGFPYPISGKQVATAKKVARDLFFNNKWPKQQYPLSWLLEKFWPVPGWTIEQLTELKKKDPPQLKRSKETASLPLKTPSVSIVTPPTKGIVYYTDNQCHEWILKLAQQYLLKASNGLPIISVSLLPIDFGQNIVLDLQRGYLTMFKQIMTGIEALNTDIVFLAEHDVFYTKEHFEFIPLKSDVYYYNLNNWQVRVEDGYAVYWDCQKLSQLCANREFLLRHFRERIRRVELEGFSRRMGFEPGTHNRAERVDDFKMGHWRSNIPNLDVRHGKNLTLSRWKPSEFRNPCKNWTESYVNLLPGWEDLNLRPQEAL